jgi:hypothetical protein
VSLFEVGQSTGQIVQLGQQIAIATRTNRATRADRTTRTTWTRQTTRTTGAVSVEPNSWGMSEPTGVEPWRARGAELCAE